ncbi:aminoglycoside phosphotransferase family protein [Phenylobacterium sp. LH3H17]|uniref:aminoglycoside phosphotransferase family protein n=1 Tax=Phenylobacterium sp. LH3H17 TaxID=2903901 RepID=UPI0020C9B529|nr:aminoglycoside phosphotransferase family protein [Phenylobacterium sp. LH3H17]UTP39094.1 aminoglycoside phosphotransferase family protein [Phenylobacterium sp. LH3H17]
MADRAIEVPGPVRLRAEAAGEAGVAWLNGLGDLVAGLERDWGLAVGSTLHGGTGSYVAQATTREGEPAVLKLGMPGEDVTGEIATLVRAEGRGYVRLLRHDAARAAMLQERLGPSLSSLDLSVEDRMAAICRTLQAAWTTSPQGLDLMTGAEKARWLGDFIGETWEALDRPCSERAVAQGLAYAERRAAAFDPDACVLVHGDAHDHNTLRVPGTELFKFVDPDGLAAEPACDLAVPMREWSAELLAGDPLELGLVRCARLSALTGVEAGAIWEWGVMERLSTGLLATKLAYQPEGREMLAVADAWAFVGPLP